MQLDRDFPGPFYLAYDGGERWKQLARRYEWGDSDLKAEERGTGSAQKCSTMGRIVAGSRPLPTRRLLLGADERTRRVDSSPPADDLGHIDDGRPGKDLRRGNALLVHDRGPACSCVLPNASRHVRRLAAFRATAC